MSRIEKLSLVLSTLVILSACKKTDPPGSYAASPPVVTTNQNGDPVGTYNGLLISMSMPSPTFTLSTAWANFYSTPRSFGSNNPTSGGITTVNSVSFNNVNFKFDPTGPTYGDTTYSLTLVPATWNVVGGASIPSFTYTSTTPIPAYNSNGLPTTVNRNQDLVVPISGAAGYDQLMLQVDDGGVAAASYVSSSATTVTIAKDSLAKLSASTGTGKITVTLIKYSPQNLGGKAFLFGTAYYYVKGGITIN